MRLYVLLPILPPDLVHYISQIIRNKAANIIRDKFMFKRSMCITAIRGIINFSLSNNYEALITNDIVSSFKTVIDYYIPQKYNKQFWDRLLNVTSFTLYNYYIHYSLRFYNNNNNDNYYYLKIIINTWLNLCKKFDITIHNYTGHLLECISQMIN
jgi:hypothetical protein